MANLASDKPITSESEDVLGLTSFADALAKSLAEMTPDEGLVVSVQGEWGSGKTSAIELAQRRLVIRELAKERGVSIAEIEQKEWTSVESEWNSIARSRRTHIVRFNPWNFSGKENLVRAFFKEVGVTIGYPPDGPISRAINKITDHLPNAGTLLGGVIGGATTGAAAVGPGAAVGRAAGEGIQRILSSPGSLESGKQELAMALRESGKRIIVIVDDLDRLLPSEMRAMFSLVKSLGDLPNVLYVLSFDDKAVSLALSKGVEPVEAKFLEKIVQVPLKLPPPWEPEVRQLFFNRINAVIGDAGPNDSSRWRSVFFQAVAPYVRTPRDVARFANTLQVIWPNVAGDVDFTDLIILITLQLFEHETYQMVFDNIESLAGESITFEDDKAFAGRFEPREATDPHAAKKALSYLFPKLAKGWNQHVWDGTSYLKKREQRRICTREYYRNYFLFGRDPDRISRADIEGALGDANPGKRLNELIVRLANANSRRGASRVASLLDQILEIVFAKPLLSESVVCAILDLSDELVNRKDIVWELFPTDNFERLDSILVFGLEPLPPEQRMKLVQKIASHHAGLSVSTMVVERLAGQHGLYGQQARFESERLVPLDVIKQAVTKVLVRIRKAAREGRILSMPEPMRLIWAWKRLADTDEVKIWLAKQLRRKDAVVRLGECLPGTSYRTGGDEGQVAVRSFKADTYKDLLDVGQLKSRLKKFASKADASAETQQIYSDFLAAEQAGKESRF